MVTRKLRRRAHCDSTPLSEGKRRKATAHSLVYLLDDSEVEEDMKTLCKVRPVISFLFREFVTSAIMAI